MKIDLFNIEEFVDINELQEVKSAVLFQRGDIPHPEGLISNEIFGITTKSRKETFAYIDLHGYFFVPHVYKVLKRLYRNIEKIINGELYVSIGEDGRLVKDENGETGLEFIYNNWDKIQWALDDTDSGMKKERLNLVKTLPKKEIFSRYAIVIPAFYRDIKSTSSGGEVDNINNLYGKLIRTATLVKEKDLFSFQFNMVNYNIQNTLVDIYDFFKHKLEKKQGLLRKYLLGRNVDYCTRSVITAPSYHANRPEDLMIDFRHANLPISQICSLCFPFVMAWVKKFFEREVFDTKNSKIIYDPVTDTVEDNIELKNPESYFSDRYLKKMIDTYIKDPESRFDKIFIPSNSNHKLYLRFTGKRIDPTTKAELPSIAYRPMTWTDILYMACEDVTRDKHCMITRYPLLDEFGIFIAEIRVCSTTETDMVSYNGKIYNWYPRIDFDVPSEKIASKFLDSIQFSNSYLPGLDGDYDGDQTTVKIVYTQEANAELTRIMNQKTFFINALGRNIRKVENEAIQTLYTLTKNPPSNPITVSPVDKKYFLSLKPEDITFENFVLWFGNLADSTNGRTTEQQKSKFNPTDVLTLTPKEYPMLDKPITTTLGRFIYTKFLVEGIGLENVVGFINYVLDDGGCAKIENLVADALKEDKITVDQMYKYIDYRDWFSLQMHSVITTSFTRSSIIVPDSVKKLKKDLLKKYKKELQNHDNRASEKIENALVAKVKEELKDDVGMDLYVSGARGSIGNNYKNINLIRGAVKNSMTGEFDIIGNSFLDGLKKEDIPAHANTIVQGAYP